MIFTLSGKQTEIIWGKGIEVFPSENKVYVVDANVYDLHRDILILGDNPVYLFEALEENKNLQEVEKLYNFFLENNVNRSTTVIGIGGGITTDITAYAASSFKRGCRLCLVPTTLLGMVDAALGGKTAVNFNDIKNCIGSFYPAEQVIINPGFFKTLPHSEMMNGWAECIKMAFIKESPLFELLMADVSLNQIVEETVKLKMEICEVDPEDRGERRLLNLGHTFGHVLESLSNYEISHGMAVAFGLRMAADISRQLGYIDDKVESTVNDLLDKYDFPRKIQAGAYQFQQQQIENILLQDKKADSEMKLVLMKGFRKTEVIPLNNINLITSVLEKYISSI